MNSLPAFVSLDANPLLKPCSFGPQHCWPNLLFGSRNVVVCSAKSSVSSLAAISVGGGLNRIESLTQVSGVLGCQWVASGLPVFLFQNLLLLQSPRLLLLSFLKAPSISAPEPPGIDFLFFYELPNFNDGLLFYRARGVAVPAKTIGVTKCVAAPEKIVYKTKVNRNENIGKLQAGYLFPKIARRRNAHLQKYPDAKIIPLGIGDTTEPIPEYIATAMAKRALAMATLEGYSGYGPEQGEEPLRAAIAKTFYDNQGIEEDDIFVSDGAKCDISRLQLLFGEDKTIAVQDPSYPAYVDSSVIMGQTGLYEKSVEKFGKIEYMRCTPDNGFFPDLSSTNRTDIIFFCSPNNPTGSAATREQLTQFVKFAKDNGSIIVYDSAYAMYMSDDNPRSIFEIPEVKDVAIETSSFSMVYGGTNAPYVWVHFPGQSSWDVFAEILEKTHVVTTPGSGFGPGDEGFIRVSAFGHRENVLEACSRFKQLYK